MEELPILSISNQSNTNATNLHKKIDILSDNITKINQQLSLVQETIKDKVSQIISILGISFHDS